MRQAPEAIAPGEPPGRSQSENLRGAAWMVTAMFGYLVNDTMMKVVLDELPLFQTIFIRGLLITCVLGVYTARSGGLSRLRTYWSRPVGLRVGTEMLATVLYLSALSHVPIGNLVAIVQILPIAVTFVAARLLRERLSPHRIGAVLAGFCGVLLVVRPGSADFNLWYLAGFAGVVFFVIREVSTVEIDHRITSLDIAWLTAFVITIMGGVGLLFGEWTAPEGRHLGLIGAAATVLTFAYFASVVTVRTGDLSFSAPFRYVILAAAMVAQIVVFDDVPDALAFVGAAIIMAAGLYALAAEQRSGKAPAARTERLATSESS